MPHESRIVLGYEPDRKIVEALRTMAHDTRHNEWTDVQALLNEAAGRLEAHIELVQTYRQMQARAERARKTGSQ